MAFEHGCFISHVHAKEALMREFVDELAKALRSELEPLIGDFVKDTVYLDEERLKGGEKFNLALARALCASACWVMVYVPQYFRRPYCQREFRAMQILEERRLTDIGLEPHKGMIIPIILRGERERLPNGLGEEVHCLEFSRFSTSNSEIIRHESFIDQIAERAAFIEEVFQLGNGLTEDCSQFSIPELEEIPAVVAPKQGFPGRPDPPPQEQDAR
ncbi:MAG: hypothetical protein QOF13_2458 [Solirubrobacterales bacterium]|jgi:hypothetical protein|nr:hypothetical protein [Solirubrobacterales bacterium]